MRKSAAKQTILQAKIQNLHFVKGWNCEDVCESLEISRPTFYNYTKKIKEMEVKDASGRRAEFMDPLYWLWVLCAKFDEAIKKCWNEWNRTNDPKVKAMFMALIRDFEKLRIEKLQDTGNAPRVKDKEIAETTIIFKSHMDGELVKKDKEEVK